MKEVVVIGGGAAGLFCALNIKRLVEDSANVVILERLEKVGKKILATGNGRCNYLHDSYSVSDYHSQNREYLEDFYELYANQTFMTYMSDKKKNQRIFELLERWYGETEKTHIKDLGYANLLFSYFIEEYSLTKRAHKNVREELIKVLLLYIHEHYLENITLAKVSKALGYSVDYCSRILKKYIGRDFRDYINMLRIRKAQALMLDKSLNMTTLEILYKCGFQSAATFYRAKKRFLELIKRVKRSLPAFVG